MRLNIPFNVVYSHALYAEIERVCVSVKTNFSCCFGVCEDENGKGLVYKLYLKKVIFGEFNISSEWSKF